MPIDYKVVLYGDFGVGKTSISNYLYRREFKSPCSTIGASFQVWNCQVDNKKCVLGIWDTAGQERFSSIVPMYVRGSDAVLFCWDSSKSFDWEVIENKYNYIKTLCPSCIFYIVFTKTDLCNEIPNKRGELFINQKQEGGCFYTSAKEGKGIDDMFIQISKHMIKVFPHKIPYFVENLNTSTSKSYRCCSNH